jgi:nucleoside-diphosphate-sugar epimerase
MSSEPNIEDSGLSGDCPLSSGSLIGDADHCPQGHRNREDVHVSAGETVLVTGAARGLGRELVARLGARPGVEVVALDTERGDLVVPWRAADVRDPLLGTRLAGADVVVHLAVDMSLETPAHARRLVNVRGTANLLEAARTAGVRRVVLVTSAMVYGALADNPQPLREDSPLRARPDVSLVGDWVEIERLRLRAARQGMDITVLRPAILVGPNADSVFTRYFQAPRLLMLAGANPAWQFCHEDDLLAALELAAAGKVSGAVNVACPGSLSQRDVQQLTGKRSVVLPAAVAVGTAERLHALGITVSPPEELDYLRFPWTVSCDRLSAADWTPRYDNAAALQAHLAFHRPDRHLQRQATRAAAGASVALVGTLAVLRARAHARARRR